MKKEKTTVTAVNVAYIYSFVFNIAGFSQKIKALCTKTLDL
jgi:hypothetical protein